MEPVQLSWLLGEQVQAFSRRKPRRQIELATDVETSVVGGQSGLVTLVVDNLISNADEYSPPREAAFARVPVC